MIELLRTNDPVLLSRVRARLEGEGVAFEVFDGHTSIMEGSIGALPRRIMVDDDDVERARRLLAELGVETAPVRP